MGGGGGGVGGGARALESASEANCVFVNRTVVITFKNILKARNNSFCTIDELLMCGFLFEHQNILLTTKSILFLRTLFQLQKGLNGFTNKNKAICEPGHWNWNWN